jgi:NAD dependent epimerase/dehydratase
MKVAGSKVLVTGAGGFIGSHLCERLVAGGANVKAMLHYSSRSDNSNLDHLSTDVLDQIEIVKGDVQDLSFVESAIGGVDIVFHLAALIGIPYSYLAPTSYVGTNILGTLNVLEAVKKSGRSVMVHTSTSETYGTAIYTPIDEKHPLQGQSPYSATKIGADKLVESYHNSFELPVVTIRPFNCYGPRQSARAVIPTIISQALKNPKISLGDTTPIRDFTFVRDTVNGFALAPVNEKAIGQTINIGTGKGISIADLARLILQLMGRDLSVTDDLARVRPKDSEVMHLLCDNRLADELLGWKPQTSFRDGLNEVINFVKQNLSLFDTTKYTV